MEWEVYNSLVCPFWSAVTCVWWVCLAYTLDKKSVAGRISRVASIPVVYRESSWRSWYIP